MPLIDRVKLLETASWYTGILREGALVSISTILSFGFCSGAQSRLTFCDPMNYSLLGFPVLHHLLELVQTYVC